MPDRDARHETTASIPSHPSSDLIFSKVYIIKFRSIAYGTVCTLKKNDQFILTIHPSLFSDKRIYLLHKYITAPAQRSATSLSTPSSSSSIVLNAEKETSTERGVSVDQDGKSNVWAIEPKMEVSTKSGEEKTKSYLIGGVGLIVFAGIAGVALTNLPDPNLL